MVKRDDLRVDLIASLDAARELAPEDQCHLVDIFLRDLESRYRLVPRDIPMQSFRLESHATLGP